MSRQGYQILAVIPARGGSKGIPRKNLCKVAGLSLVGHAARVVRSLSWLDRAILSTEDEEIAAEGKKHGLTVPFLRPQELAGDNVKSVDLWRQGWLSCEAFYRCHFDLSILLEPTSPLRLPEDIEKTVDVLIGGSYLAAATVSRAPAHFTPHKCLTVDEKGLIGFFLEEGARYSLRQDIPPFYYRNGICYAVTRKALLEHGTILEKDCAAVIIERPVVNIDEPLDLEIADFLYRRQKEQLPWHF